MVKFTATDDNANLSALDFSNIGVAGELEYSGVGVHQVDQNLIDEFNTINGSGGVNTLSGSSGDDVFDFSTTTLTSIENIDMLGGNDQVKGSSGADTIELGSGNDIATSSGGADVISGSDGDDSFNLDFSHLATLSNFDGGTTSQTNGDIVNLSNYDTQTIDNTQNTKFDNIESIDLNGAGTISIDVEALSNFKEVAASDITISSSGDDTLNITANGANFNINDGVNWVSSINDIGVGTYDVDTDNITSTVEFQLIIS